MNQSQNEVLSHFTLVEERNKKEKQFSNVYQIEAAERNLNFLYTTTFPHSLLDFIHELFHFHFHSYLLTISSNFSHQFFF
jgi:hypothetical protein